MQHAFIVSTGRCGTTALGLLVNESANAVAVNEGQIRAEDLSGRQPLRALTLENLQAYRQPEKARQLFEQARGPLVDEFTASVGKGLYVEIAYYLAPFVAVLPELYPDAKVLYLTRDGRTFVRDIYVDETPDPMPVGYLDRGPATKQELFVSYGRLRPNQDDALAGSWPEMSPFEKNTWLWTETNRLILDGLDKWPEEQVMHLKMEDMFQKNLLGEALGFLGVEGVADDKIEEILGKRVNSRKKLVLPQWPEWSGWHRERFNDLALDMMRRLGYLDGPDW